MVTLATLVTNPRAHVYVSHQASPNSPTHLQEVPDHSHTWWVMGNWEGGEGKKGAHSRAGRNAHLCWVQAAGLDVPLAKPDYRDTTKAVRRFVKQLGAGNMTTGITMLKAGPTHGTFA